MQTLTEPRAHSRTKRTHREPVFVLAAPHSLSSLLCAALGQHPEIYATPGLHLLSGSTVSESTAIARSERPSQLHSLLRTIADIYSSEQTIESIEMARRWLRRREHLPADEVYRELCQTVAPRILVERCTIHAGASASMASMDEAFPDARYIFLVRHPFAQGRAALGDLHSVKKLMHDQHQIPGKPAPCLDPQFAWFEAQIAILEFLESIPKENQTHLRLEDLAARPSAVLQDLCSWLDVSMLSEALAAMLAFEKSAFFAPGPFNAIAGYDPNIRTRSSWNSVPAEPPLEGALPWRKDAGLASRTLELAQAFGYGAPSDL